VSAPLEEARVRVLDATAALRDHPVDELRAFVDTPQTERLQIQRKPIDFTTWAREHGTDKVAVIVEARRQRFLGWSQVTADGFYKDSHGVTPFVEKDYWEHGY
jgi:hypothetical protein